MALPRCKWVPLLCSMDPISVPYKSAKGANGPRALSYAHCGERATREAARVQLVEFQNTTNNLAKYFRNPNWQIIVTILASKILSSSYSADRTLPFPITELEEIEGPRILHENALRPASLAC